MKLTGRTAVITGGASGIGLATARRVAASGMRLVLADRDEGAMATAVTVLAEAGADVIGVACDVALEADVERVRDEALAAFGAVHLIFNNAGVVGGPAIGTPKGVWDWVLGVNLDGVINGVNVFLPLLLEQDEGHVVNTASLAGLAGQPGTGAYCASKFAVVGLSESLFYELALRGGRVGVSVLCPGFVRTRIHESDRSLPASWRDYLDDPMVRSVRELGAVQVNAGIEADDVAALVEAAVRENRYWILPHERLALRLTERRLEWMGGGRPLTPPAASV